MIIRGYLAECYCDGTLTNNILHVFLKFHQIQLDIIGLLPSELNQVKKKNKKKMLAM